MSKQAHFVRLVRLLKRHDHEPHIYEWFNVETFFEDCDTIEQIADEIFAELQNNYVSPYKPQSRQKSDEEKKIARMLQDETLRRRRIFRNPTLKAEYDAELDKKLRTEIFKEHVESRKRESFSKTNNPSNWPPTEKELAATSTSDDYSDSEIIETEDLSDESIDAPPIIATFNSNVADDIPDINTLTKERQRSSLTKPLARNTPANQARYRQRKLKQRRQMWLIFLGGLAGILLGYLLLKVLEI